MDWRDYNGERGPVPTAYRAHDWQTCRRLRELSEEALWLAERAGFGKSVRLLSVEIVADGGRR